MLTYLVMGLLALAILWLNTLLVAGATLGQLRTLVAKIRSLRQLRAAAIKEAPSGVFARFEVHQVGRRAADDDARPAIVFHDRSYRETLEGGVLEIAGERVAIEPGQASVWVEREALERASACAGTLAFESAYASARKAKGFARTVAICMVPGDVIHVAGSVSEGRFEGTVASFDPRPLLEKKALMLAGFAVSIVIITAGVTALCLVRPLFGFWSTIGGLGGLVHFLFVMQPLGVTVRDAARLPSQAALRGSWIAPASVAASSPPSRRRSEIGGPVSARPPSA